MIDIQAEDVAQDGSITVKLDGKPIKFVKESDLGAIKVQLKDKEGEVSTLQANLATANTKYDESHQEVLKERAAKEQFEKDAKESATHKTRVGELETEVAGLKTSSGEVETKLTERLRLVLTEGYKIDAEKIKDMALGDLEQTEKTLALAGKIPALANYDGKGGAGGGAPSDLGGKDPLALFNEGYKESGVKK